MPRTTKRAEAFLCDLPAARPRSDAIQSFNNQETIYVEIETASGQVGLGYAYTIGTGGRAVLELLSHDVLPLLPGEDANRIEQILVEAVLVDACDERRRSYEPCARCRRHRARGHPLFGRGLAALGSGGGSRDEVPVYDTEGGWLNLTIDELIAEAEATAAAGWSGFKMKVGKPHVSEDVERVAQVRSALGTSTEIMVDANQSLSWPEAMRLARLLEPLDVYWLEEPMPADDISGHVRLVEYLCAGAAGVVQVDAARIGGITPWLKTAHLAEAFNVKVAPHFLMELHVSLAAAVPNASYVEHIPQLAPLTTGGLEIRAGKALAPNEPGLGIQWDRDLIARARASE